ncbi:hypothetical protein Misp06_00236 [Microbulbifer sp. NBRC 101763]|uniref:hypothetical protein n=1 Tax=Microbulbifer TaxID=48073 RepID=UPI00037ECCB2|nr:hypothetical protein [Microbulbifer variabilis]
MSKFLHSAKWLLGSLVLLSGQTLSYDVGSSPVEYLRTYKGYAVATLTNEGPNPNGCTATYKNWGAGRYVAIEFDTEEGQEMYSALLAAYLSGNKVAFGAYDGKDRCKMWNGTNTIPVAYRIDILRK